MPHESPPLTEADLKTHADHLAMIAGTRAKTYQPGLHGADRLCRVQDIPTTTYQAEAIERGKLVGQLMVAEKERDQYHDALIARHGGEPVVLLGQLDEVRAEVERLRARCKTMEELLTEGERLIRRTPGQHAIDQQLKQFAKQNRWLASHALLEVTP